MGKTIPCLLPSVLDFGLVTPGEKPGGMAGVCNWKTAGHVMAKFQDHSGGLFTGLTLGVYDVQVDDSGDVPHPGKIHPVRWILVEMANGDGGTPLPVLPGQTVGVGLFFNAPGQTTGVPFTADIEIISPESAVVITIPVTASVEAPDVIGGVQWNLANPFGIQQKDFSISQPLVGPLNAGHVNDAFVLGGNNGGSLLVGTSNAGVWIVRQPGADIPPTGGPLTKDWGQTSIVNCLCQGSHSPENIYVGMSAGIVEIDDFSGNWRPISPPPSIAPGGVGNVYRIVVTVGAPRRIVIATDVGVFWSLIPSAGSSAYLWHSILSGGQYGGLALGFGDRIVAAAWGTGTASGIAIGHFGMFYGDWLPSVGDLGADLVMSRVPESNMPPMPGSLLTFSKGMGRTSVASCSSNPGTMYAVCANTDGGTLWGVLKSEQNGASWVRVGIDQSRTQSGDLYTHAGGQGGYNNCIAVAPTDPTRALFGWQHGTFELIDSGNSFKQFAMVRPDTNHELHDDVHGVYFDPADPTNNTFYICSDGGVAKTQDDGRTFDSSFNRYLANLECYGISVHGNLLACALQDNSNVYCWLRPGNVPNVSPWIRLDYCDGAVVAVIATGQLISALNCDIITQAKLFQPWANDPVRFVDPGDTFIPVRDQNGDDKTGLQMSQVEPVANPNYENLGGQKMYAVACGRRTSEIATNTGLQAVYGLFSNTGGADMHWEKITDITSDIAGDIVTYVAALDDGTRVLVGTNAGRLFLLRPSPTGPVIGQQLAVSQPKGPVSRVVFVSATLAFAVSASTILRFDGSTWSEVGSGLPGGPYKGLARDGYNRTWTCTENQVWVSRDDGLTWKDASFGLPKPVHCQDLRYNFAQQNPPLLYLSTYGNSVWVADVLG